MPGENATRSPRGWVARVVCIECRRPIIDLRGNAQGWTCRACRSRAGGPLAPLPPTTGGAGGKNTLMAGIALAAALTPPSTPHHEDHNGHTLH